MQKECHYIAGEWRKGYGEKFSSFNPATYETHWVGNSATEQDIDDAVSSAREQLPKWSRLSFEQRCRFIHLFEKKLKQHAETLAETISSECGKPLWESKQEVSTVLNKIEISIEAYKKRCPDLALQIPGAHLAVHHKPHGVIALFGPFNFPAHLPCAHLIPALLAGNCVVLKGSELTPKVSELLVSLLSDLPEGVFNCLQGGAASGQALVSHPQIDGVFFTGSQHTGLSILETMKSHPEKIVSLEMGGNNPLLIWDVSDLEAAAYLTIQSAFLTSGQRCSSARRLILPRDKQAAEFLKVLIHMSAALEVGPYTASPEPFMGPVISLESAEKMLDVQARLGTGGGKCLVEMRPLEEHLPFLTPGIIDVSEVQHRVDEEFFGPFLQVIHVNTFEEAIREANQTSYGLAASLLSRSKEKFEQFYHEIRAGVINWNSPTTGASSKAPFGGVGKSGNHRPSGYYAADYCAYPVASIEREEVHLPSQINPGITFLAKT